MENFSGKPKSSEIKLIIVLMGICLLSLIICYILIYHIKADLNSKIEEMQKEIATKNITNEQEQNIENISEPVKPTICATIEIPKLELKQSVFSVTTNETLAESLCKLLGPEPNEIGNFVIVGDKDEEGKKFGKLGNLVEGDVIKLSDNDNNTETYEVYSIYEASTIYAMSATQDTKYKEVTLITEGTDVSKRLIVKAKEI